MIPRTVFGSEHDIFRESVARFMDQDIAPSHDQWEKLAQECGPRFAPPALLRDMAAKGKGFYQ